MEEKEKQQMKQLKHQISSNENVAHLTDKGIRCDFDELDEEEYASALRAKLNLDLPSESDEMVSQWNHKQFFAKVLPSTMKSRKASAAHLRMRHRSVTTTNAATL